MVTYSPILSMFGRSPIRPLQTHIDTAHQCAEQLIPFIKAVFDQDWSLAEQIQLSIVKLEQSADSLKKDLRLHLPKGLFLPVPRSDILELLTTQDQIANRAKDIAGTILGRRMRFDTLADDYLSFLQKSIDAAQQARKAIHELDELLETGFRGSEVKLVEDMITQLDTIEHDSDDMQIGIRYQLYQLEANLPPVDVMFTYKVIEMTGDLADCAQRVGARLELLLAR
jgi:uncharacterized protein